MPTGIETCGKCHARFDTRGALVNLGEARGWLGFLGVPAIPPWVACPRCGHEARATEMRYFGLLPPNGLRWLLFAFTVAMLAAGFLFILLPDLIR